MLFQTGYYRIFSNIQNTENTGCTPFFCQQCKTILNRLSGITVFHLFAMQLNCSAMSCCYAKDILKTFCTAAAVQTCKTNNLPLTHLKGYILQQRILSRQIFYFQCHITRLIRLRRKLIAQLTSNHQTDDLFCSKIFCIFGSNILSVTHNRNFIRNT